MLNSVLWHAASVITASIVDPTKRTFKEGGMPADYFDSLNSPQMTRRGEAAFSYVGSIVKNSAMRWQSAMRHIIFVSSAAAALIGSFALTLWLTRSQPPSSSTGRPPNEALATYNISNRSELIEAAVALGLHASTRVKGSIEAIKRVNDQEVTIEGWMADPQGGDTPLNVLVFVDGAFVGAARTHDERPDVTTELGLAFGAEKNVTFQVTIACRSGGEPIVVGVGVDADYFLFKSPSQCP
jgi:hypothetical protein